MSDNNRPEWASGPEWEGWQFYHHTSMTRKFKDSMNSSLPIPERLYTCYIDHFGMQIVSPVDDVVISGRDRQLEFLKAANALAEAAGGWA